jgi:hypothetical protein
MLRLDKVIKPWKESAALNDHINLYGFWNETAFLTKSGDLGMVLSVSGVDYESLDRSEQEYAVKRLEAALKAFGPGFHVYQYLFKSNCPIYRSQRMTTPSSKRLSTSDGSSLKPSATIFIRLKSSTASCSKAPGRRPASAQR